MKKISTLFKKDPKDLGRVINEIAPENSWVLDGFGIATRKLDGTATAIINGELYKRFDIKLFKRKRGKIIKFTQEQLEAKKPIGAIPCQEPDKVSGHHPHWVKCDRNNPADKWHFVAFDNGTFKNGTYELCGEKIQGNPEKIKGHCLIKHGEEVFKLDSLNYESIKDFLSTNDIEGIVFHHKNDDRMCKIRKTDFGIKRI